MSDGTILYMGIVCFSMIILAFVLTTREFSKMARSDAAGKRIPGVSYTT